MDTNADDEIVVEILPTIRTYRSGRVERLQPTDFVPASLDPPTAVLSKDLNINPFTLLSVRLYLPTLSTAADNRRKFPVFVFFHGGGFCIGSAFSSIYHSYLNSLVSRAQVIAVSVDFRLAPENPLPAAYDDSWEALKWISGASGNSEPWLTEAADLGKIFLAGDSTGANIAHNMAVRLGQNNSPVEGLVLMHPYFWGKERIGSEREEKEGVMLKSKDADALWPFVCPGTSGLDDPRVNPTADGGRSLAALGCRRVMVSVAGRDLLRERGRLYFEKLKKSGWEGEAEFLEAEGEDHVFFLLNPGGEKAVEFMERLVTFLNKK
ncbi:probable carboxylesterase 2 [Dendrobium catenatum]|uniref:Putative carboxylesterase 2 n=1 Tax=Dendrobium catenatum TaxID=906689 RepID=A0A2I0W0E1_9ASPA|nr:probable carboxylesterase 2 [Dendrobium catenatum]PKU69119.1 putative carboxylesterase 2 [Dendrobium catenatum]